MFPFEPRRQGMLILFCAVCISVLRAEDTELPDIGKTVHVVRAGDTLWGVAKKYYGSGAKWERILNANLGLDPEKLPVWAELDIPGSGRERASGDREDGLPFNANPSVRQYSLPTLAPDGTKAVLSANRRAVLLDLSSRRLQTIPLTIPETSEREHSVWSCFGGEVVSSSLAWSPDSRWVLLRGGASFEDHWTLYDANTAKLIPVWCTAPWEPKDADNPAGPLNPLRRSSYDQGCFSPDGRNILFTAYGCSSLTHNVRYDIDRAHWEPLSGSDKVVHSGWLNTSVVYFQSHCGTECASVDFLNAVNGTELGTIGSNGSYSISSDGRWVLDVKLHRGVLEMYALPKCSLAWKWEADYERESLSGNASWCAGAAAFAVSLQMIRPEATRQNLPSSPQVPACRVRIWDVKKNGPQFDQTIPDAVLDPALGDGWFADGRYVLYLRDHGHRNSPSGPTRLFGLAVWDREQKTSREMIPASIDNLHLLRVGSGSIWVYVEINRKYQLYACKPSTGEAKLIVSRDDRLWPVPHGVVADGKQVLVSYVGGEGYVQWSELRSVDHPDQFMVIIGERR